jgi:hypothetical protein
MELKQNIEKHPPRSRSARRSGPAVLQVQVQDATKGIAQQVVDSSAKSAAKVRRISRRLIATTLPTIATADTTQAQNARRQRQRIAQFRTFVAEHHPLWILTSIINNDFRMNLKPSELIEIKRRAVEQIH